MEHKEVQRQEIKDLFKAKELFHKELAQLPFEEKIKILIHLQKIANGTRTSSKKNQRIWKIPFNSPQVVLAPVEPFVKKTHRSFMACPVHPSSQSQS